MLFQNKLYGKFTESLKAVVPIMTIMLILSLCIAPIPSGILLGFMFGGLFVIIGMTLFSLGAELAMGPMGQYLGTRITRTKKLWLILLFAFVLGFMITISEPDLQVLAGQIASVPDTVLIVAVAVGVGLFLVIAMLRIFFGISLSILLFVLYVVVFLLAAFVPESFLAIAFDSGGVTTGPMTVPFIMAFGIGISAIRSDKHAANDSFGLVSLSSVGPVLAVLFLGLVFHRGTLSYEFPVISNVSQSTELSEIFLKSIPIYLRQVAAALIPVAVFFFVFLLFCPGIQKKNMTRILVGLVYTFTGLVVFLLGVNAGFMPAGYYFGRTLGSYSYQWVVIPIGMVIGFFIVRAEPAVHVLMNQVEELTDGDISGRTLQTCLSIGMSGSVALSMIRVLTGIPILWFLIPGYGIALILAFFVPKIFTAIAFDSGGVVSGPMTATFLLPFAIGTCRSAGGNVVTDAFGVVAMVAMTPLITIQILGMIYRFGRTARFSSEGRENQFDQTSDYTIIEF